MRCANAVEDDYKSTVTEEFSNYELKATTAVSKQKEEEEMDEEEEEDEIEDQMAKGRDERIDEFG
ncbi:hypothetical protein HK100_002260 [Physocladia obscura]|uniref:Uncharacterized protein n=1 Tax=Physocladia obscura TaxID=109957 RepID=A0AAD5SXR4_9FUNG|nr:hypothetical protein HK100_002260 [Physocladia obscura]